MSVDHRFRPYITVACVVHAQEHFLLVEETKKGQILLNQPAGHLEADETLLQAASRELFEETGIKAAPQSLLKIFQWIAPDKTPFIRFTFVVELEQMQVATPQDKDIGRCLWLTYDKIASANNLRSPMVHESLLCYRQPSRYPLEILDAFSWR